MPLRFSLSACAISRVRFLGTVLPLAEPTRFALVRDAWLLVPLLSSSYFDFSAKFNGVRPSLFVMIGLAPTSSKYFTIKKCPLKAAICSGVFLRYWVCSFTSWPSLMMMRTMSSSPSLQDFQMSVKL